MAIEQSHYIKITSGVGGSNNVRSRELILRIFSVNSLIPGDSILEFTSADDVGKYFGTDSEEYKRTVKYFGYISPSIVQASKISFARDQNTASAPMVIGASGSYQVDTLKSLSGTVSGSVGDSAFTTSSISFSSAESLAGISLALQSALRAVSSIDILSAVTVSYNSAKARFEVVAGDNESVAIKFNSGTIADALGLSTGTVIQGGAAELSESESVAAADDISTNYGSFLFLRKLTLAEIVALASTNAAKNIAYMYLIGCTESEAAEYSSALLSIGSVGVTLISDDNTDYDDQIPGTLLAATDYTKTNGVISYMYKQLSGVTPKITTTDNAKKFDNLRINYYGRTQSAGQFIDFYQRGVLMGGATAAVDMNVHGNEQWLKDSCAVSLLSLQLSLNRISANNSGRGKIIATLQDSVDTALNNGTISVEKTLTTQQKLYIAQLTGDDLAWQQVQNIGYWLDAVISQYVTEDGRTEYECIYTLIYSKDDVIRRVQGTHVLI